MIRVFLFGLVFALVLCGCTTTTNVLYCTPSSDLPAEKKMEKAPEESTPPERLYGLLVDERRGRAQDQRDYNSLYKQCVSNAASTR